MSPSAAPSRATPKFESPGVPADAAPSTPVVGPESYLTLHYRLRLDAEAVDVVSTFGGKPATLQLGAGQLSPALEEHLIGLESGARRSFALPPDAAFGPRNPDLVRRVPRALLEAESERTEYSPGDAVEFNAPGGGRYAGVFRSFENDYAVFDFNHPLAGQPIRFDVEIVGIL